MVPRSMILLWLCIATIVLAPISAPIQAQNKLPKVPEDLSPQIETLQSGVKLQLLAEHPSLATPTGIDVDSQGRIWLAACHTHFRPENYVGPTHDEILVFDADGKNRRVFYNKTVTTMQVRLGIDGWVYLAQRDRILRVKDTDGDGVGDVEQNVAVLDTVTDYPHNGLSGMAWHPDGGLVFSLGENFGKDWTLTAQDGSKVSGRGEGGVFWCTAEGTKMRRIARGFWNPFGLLVRPDGEIFAAENDPGSRPPCRLLQVVEGADYGFQWVYGSAPVHPFVAWNGELRGTLGMIHPCGEGPSGIVHLGGGVIIPSWSNHCIDYFPLQRHGAGYTSQRIELLRGSEFFRPVCIAAGADGAFYLTDWVFSSYEVHGRGRLWKLEIDRQNATSIKPQPEPINEAAQLAKVLRTGAQPAGELSLDKLFDYARGKDSYLSDAALSAIARASTKWTPATLLQMTPEDRLWALVALRRVDLQEEKWVRALWADRDSNIQFEVLRWIADGVLTNFTDDVAQLLTRPDLDYPIFEAALATWNTLRGNPGAGVTDVNVLLERLTNRTTPPRIKGFALRLVPANHPQLSTTMLHEMLTAGDPQLSLEVVRTLSGRNAEDAWDILADLAADEALSNELRLEAILGLSHSTKPVHLALLLKFAADEVPSIRHEALRGLRSKSLDDSAKGTLQTLAKQHSDISSAVEWILDRERAQLDRPDLTNISGWMERLKQLPGKADPEAGRRIFSASKVGQCAECHRHSGRGNVVGPDLSLIARQGEQVAILRSILEPNRDVAPQYFTTALELADGNVFSGILLRSSNVDVFRDSTGKERAFQKSEIVQRKELKTSLMPTGLIGQMTDQDLRDLLMFLSGSPVE